MVHDYKKITLNSCRSLALGIAGHTQDHYYTQAIERSISIDEGLWIVRKHMEGFLRVHDLASLSTLTSFTVNVSPRSSTKARARISQIHFYLARLVTRLACIEQPMA